jgi:7-cyano-7-deazaguanine synthase in queuosine biosynthesis
MKDRSVFCYRFSRHNLADPGVSVTSSDRTFRASEDRFRGLAESAGPVPEWADDFLCIAKAIFAADRRSPRVGTDDQWTRTIELAVELIEPDVWTSQVEEFSRLLTLLTGDEWRIEFTAGGTRIDHGRQPFFSIWEAEEVALFSGGLDSTTYAASRFREGGGPLLLVAYYEQKEKKPQESVFNALSKIGSRDVQLHQISQGVFKEGRNPEPSSRSRGLLYTVTAMYAAAAHGVTTVTVPENGQLAINPPLTAARAAACSTRSVHPHTLDSLNRLIRNVGGDIRIVNPFGQLTKGEVCDRAIEAGVPEDTLWSTMSCGRPPIHRFNQELHCGRCFPCLVRRSGLLHATGKDHTPYKNDLRSSMRNGKLPEDVLALWRWLGTQFSTRDLIADVSLPAGTQLPDIMAMLRRGRAELEQMIRTVLPADSDYLHNWDTSFPTE